MTGQLGLCAGTVGPGAIHLLNGLYDAKTDNAPVLALTGQVPREEIRKPLLTARADDQVGLRHLCSP